MKTNCDSDDTSGFELKRHDKQDVQMAFYEYVAGRATAAMPAALAAEIGPRSIAPHLHDDNELIRPQFRSGPLAEYAGGEL